MNGHQSFPGSDTEEKNRRSRRNLTANSENGLSYTTVGQWPCQDFNLVMSNTEYISISNFIQFLYSST